MATIHVNKLLKTAENEGDVKPFFYIQVKFLENLNLMIKLQDSQTNNTFQGTLTNENIKEAAKELDIPFNDYYEECRSILTTYIALPGYIYKLDEEENVLNVWKSQPDTIPMLYLEIQLKSIKNHYDLMDSAIELLQGQTKSLNERVEKAHKFDQHSKELLEDYKLCVEEKNQLERKLLRKVAVLLNSKKQKIADLEERLRKYEDVSRAEDNEEPEPNKDDTNNDRPQNSRKRRPLVVESDTDEDDEFLANTEPMILDEETA